MNIMTYIGLAAEITRMEGYQNSRSTRPTSLVALAMLDEGQSVAPQDMDTAVKAVEWMMSQTARDVDDYIYKAQTAVSSGKLNKRTMGYLASIPQSYLRAVAREEARKAREAEQERMAQSSSHVGEVGQRITITPQSMRCAYTMSTRFGTSEIWLIEDGEGHIYKWVTSSYVDPDQTHTIVGTIKAHDTYKGVAQTVLTRCRCL